MRWENWQLSENFYWRARTENQDDLVQDLDKLPVVTSDAQDQASWCRWKMPGWM